MCNGKCTCDRGFLGSKIKDLDNGRQVLVLKNSSVFILVTSDDYIILGKQKRAGNLDNKETLGTFGGYLEDGEDYLEAAYRELQEETSLTKDDIRETFCIFKDRAVAEGTVTERSSGYIMYTKGNLEDLKLKCLDDDEDIKFKWVNIKDEVYYNSDEMPGLRSLLLYNNALTLPKRRDGKHE